MKMAKAKSPDCQDFKKLNKAVLTKGATNAAVSVINALKYEWIIYFHVFNNRLTVLREPVLT